MKLVKQSSNVKQTMDGDAEKLSHLNTVRLDAVDTDLKNIFIALQGRMRFGTGISGERGENIDGRFQTITTNATPNTQDTLAHGLGSVPIGYIVVNQDKAGSLYDSGTAWTSTNMYFKCDVASVTFTIFVLK